MKPHTNSTRRPATSCQQPPLAAYLAGAVGSAAMLGAPQAQAAVVYWNPTDGIATLYTNFSFDMVTGAVVANNGSGPTAFNVKFRSVDYVYITRTNNQTYPTVGNNIQMSNLVAGTSIDAASFSSSNGNWGYFDRTNAPGFPWNTNLDGTTGYVGLQFKTGGPAGQTHFGWAQFTYNDGVTDNITLLDFAYESVAGASIAAGDIGAAPEPSRTLLALAGLGALALRRRRKQAA